MSRRDIDPLHESIDCRDDERGRHDGVHLCSVWRLPDMRTVHLPAGHDLACEMRRVAPVHVERRFQGDDQSVSGDYVSERNRQWRAVAVEPARNEPIVLTGLIAGPIFAKPPAINSVSIE